MVYCSYYEDIKKMPSVSEHDLQSMLREESQVGPLCLFIIHLFLYIRCCAIAVVFTAHFLLLIYFNMLQEVIYYVEGHTNLNRNVEKGTSKTFLIT